MASEMDMDSKLLANDKINPTEFDITVSALLIGLGAEKYVDVFRKHNIGQCTLMELTDEDLTKLGIDDSKMRKKLIEEVKNLPIYEEISLQSSKQNFSLSPIDIVDIMEESSQHLYRIYLSVLANTLAVKKTKSLSDCLVYKDKYSSDISLATLSEIINILNSMDIALHTQLKDLSQESSCKRQKKIVVGTIGSVAITVLAVLFVRSLKQINY